MTDRKEFQRGVDWACAELKKDVAAAVVEIRNECAQICRKNGHIVSAVEIEQLGEQKQ